MAIEKKSVHVRLSPEQHMQLALLATLQGKDIAELAGALLEKMVVGEFHAVQRSARLMEAAGIIRER